MTADDRALLVAVLDAVNGLRADLARRGARPDPEQDATVLLAIAAAADGRCFAANDVLRHATVDRALAASLEAVGVTTARRLGAALARLRGRSHAGLVLERVGRDERGALWTVAAVSARRHTAASRASTRRVE